jgi:hypothetical protein
MPAQAWGACPNAFEVSRARLLREIGVVPTESTRNRFV